MIAELRYGALRSSAPERSLASVDAFPSAPLEVIPFDDAATRFHAELRLALRAHPIGERDLVIAATARAGGFVAVTGNSEGVRAGAGGGSGGVGLGGLARAAKAVLRHHRTGAILESCTTHPGDLLRLPPGHQMAKPLE